MAENHVLEIRHLSKSFGKHVVLRDIDFTVDTGDGSRPPRTRSSVPNSSVNSRKASEALSIVSPGIGRQLILTLTLSGITLGR